MFPGSSGARGLTVLEVIVATVISGVVVVGAMRLMSSTSKSLNFDQANHAADEQFQNFLQVLLRDMKNLQGGPPALVTGPGAGAGCATQPCAGVALSVPDPKSGATVNARNTYITTCQATPLAAIDFDAALPVRCLPACGKGKRPQLDSLQYPGTTHASHVVLPGPTTGQTSSSTSAAMACYSLVGGSLQVDVTLVILDGQMKPHLFRRQALVAVSNSSGVQIVP